MSQVFLHSCAYVCAASILAILGASAIQIHLGMIVFQSTVIKVWKKAVAILALEAK